MTIIDTGAAARTAQVADRAEVNRVLTAAFLDDPIFEWIAPDRAFRQAAMPGMFDAFTEAFARHDATRVLAADGAGGNGTLAGVAMWAPAGVAPVHPDDEERMGVRIAELSGPYLERMGTCLEVFEAAHPQEPAWFLQFIGVDTPRQGRGLGSRLLRDVLDVADRNGEAAYLEATSPANRALYERHGFRCIGDLPLPGGPTAWAMWRDPGAG